MRKIVTLFIAVIFCLFANAQVTKTMMWGGEQRQYLEYVPESYDPSTPTPVIFGFHGVGKTMNYFFNVSGLYRIADEHGWILIVPQALEYSIPLGLTNVNMGTTWSAKVSGTLLGYHVVLNEDVDDPGWILAILDLLIDTYNIDENSVFCTGVSMGGFMSNRMAIEHGDRIRAIASVNGTIGNELTNTTPVRHISAMHIHGTADDTISYANAEFPIHYGYIINTSVSLGLGAEATVEYWRSFNQCSTTPVYTAYPDIAADGKTFEQFLYEDGIDGTKTAFIKATGGHHEWYSTPACDIDYATEIYNFFASCIEPAHIDSLPTVTTGSITDIQTNSAAGGGNVTSDGGSEVTARGICWRTSHNPTTAHSHTTNGNGMGSFTSALTGLATNTTYYVRAYATNSVGTAYGEEVSFTTACNSVTVTVSGDTAFCEGDSTTLTASGTLAYEWSTSATTAAITVTEAGTYTVTGTDPYGCSATDSITVTFLEAPAVTISGDTTVEPGESTTLSVEENPQWTYLWNTGATTAAITVNPEETTTYSILVSNGLCDAEASITVTIADTVPTDTVPTDTVPTDTIGIIHYGTTPLQIYPNPTTGIVTIRLSPATCSLSPEIQVFDMYGKLVETFHETSLQQTAHINLSHYASGVYIIKVVNRGTPVSIGKIVKK